MTYSTKEFRAELVKIMPGYNWTVHRPSNQGFAITATGIKSSGSNRLATLSIIRREHNNTVTYEAKSAGYGTKSPWGHAIEERTLARALRGLQDHYESRANYFRSLADRLQRGRNPPGEEL